MPNAFYIGLAFGVTYLVLAGYALRVAGLTRRARAALPGDRRGGAR
jgi:heme exporter protein D